MLYSIVIPLKNEESNITPLIAEVEQAMEQLIPENFSQWELICIDDGSTDQTYNVIKALSTQKPHLKIIRFDRNYGQSSAFDAGFKAARGDFIISLDGDGQNDPADIPTLLANVEGYDLICGKRQKRQDKFSKKLTSLIANRVRSRLCHDGVQDTGCSLKVYRRSSLQKIKLFHGMHRFLPALFSMEGFKIKEVPVNHRKRLRGKSNYNFFNRSLNTIFDLCAVVWMRKRVLKYKIKHEA